VHHLIILFLKIFLGMKMVEVKAGNSEEPVVKKPRLSDEEHQDLKRRLKARKKILTVTLKYQSL